MRIYDLELADGSTIQINLDRVSLWGPYENTSNLYFIRIDGTVLSVKSEAFAAFHNAVNLPQVAR